MQHSHRRLAVVLILAGLQAAACSQQKADMSKQEKPSKIEKVAGTELSRVTVSQKAAERLGIKTAALREEQVAPRKRLVGGEVVKPAAAGADGKLWVRVPLAAGDLRSVAPEHPARVAPLGREADAKASTTARAVKGHDNAKEPVLHYAVDSPNGLALGQRVGVEVALAGAGTRKVVPHAAVVYDAKGKTWVYVATDSLTFVRQPITVDYVDGDLAVLSDGPAAGTKVVTVGAAELLGTEFGK